LSRIIEFVVTGEPRKTRDIVEYALGAHRLTVDWADDCTGSATRGSLTANVFAGALAQSFKVRVVLFPNEEPGQTSVLVEQIRGGWLLGGVFGSVRTTNNFESITDRISRDLKNAGVLVSVSKLKRPDPKAE
jgi:hypothetical protein